MWFVVTSIFAAAFFFCRCSPQPARRLEVDFSLRDTWLYACTTSVRGSMHFSDTTRPFQLDLTCFLIGTPLAADSLLVSPGSIELASSFMDDAERYNLENQLRETRLLVSARHGSAVPAGTHPLPLMNIGRWDLSRSILKALPVLPARPVAPGGTWERNRRIPLTTTHGDAVGHLYQRFTLDSIVTGPSGDSLAAVHWEFSYDIERTGSDTAGHIDELPQSGRGSGHALLSLGRKLLVRAASSFSVSPGTPPKPFSTSWNETFSMQLHDLDLADTMHSRTLPARKKP